MEDDEKDEVEEKREGIKGVEFTYKNEGIIYINSMFLSAKKKKDVCVCVCV